MNISQRNNKPNIFARSICFSLSAVFFITNVVGAQAPKPNDDSLLKPSGTSFWSERQKAVKAAQEYAQLPGNPSVSPFIKGGLRGIIPDITGIEAKAKQQSAANMPVSIVKNGPGWLRSLPYNYGTLEEFYVSPKKGSPVVVFVQDVHGHYEAQLNIANIIQQTMAGSAVVGLEGAVGAFDFSPYRAFPNKEINKEIADYFLKSGLISGPEYVGLASDTEPMFWGVEDKDTYLANIEAFKESLPLRDSAKKQIEAATRQVVDSKRKVYSPGMLALDEKIETYRNGTLGLGEYLEYLSQESEVRNQKSEPNIRLFLETFKLEKTINFQKVEDERRILIEKLVNVLGKEELENLVYQAIAHRMGNIDNSAYYHELKSICQKHGLKLSNWPELARYVRYSIGADKIDRRSLYKGINELENQVVAYVIGNDTVAKALYETSKNLSLVSKLIDNNLTDEEWNTYLSYKEKIHKTLEIPFETFEKFYETATSRNRILVENLLKQVESETENGRVRQVKSTTDKDRNREQHNFNSVFISTSTCRLSVLIAGGFHTQSMAKLLKERQISYAVLSPKLNEIDKDSHSLDVFAQKSTPLDKLMLGEKIFLAAYRNMGSVVPLAPSQIEVRHNLLGGLHVALGTMGLSPSEVEQAGTRFERLIKRLPSIKDAHVGDTYEARNGDHVVPVWINGHGFAVAVSQLKDGASREVNIEGQVNGKMRNFAFTIRPLTIKEKSAQIIPITQAQARKISPTVSEIVTESLKIAAVVTLVAGALYLIFSGNYQFAGVGGIFLIALDYTKAAGALHNAAHALRRTANEIETIPLKQLLTIIASGLDFVAGKLEQGFIPHIQLAVEGQQEQGADEAIKATIEANFKIADELTVDLLKMSNMLRLKKTPSELKGESKGRYEEFTFKVIHELDKAVNKFEEVKSKISSTQGMISWVHALETTRDAVHDFYDYLIRNKHESSTNTAFAEVVKIIDHAIYLITSRNTPTLRLEQELNERLIELKDKLSIAAEAFKNEIRPDPTAHEPKSGGPALNWSGRGLDQVDITFGVRPVRTVRLRPHELLNSAIRRTWQKGTNINVDEILRELDVEKDKRLKGYMDVIDELLERIKSKSEGNPVVINSNPELRDAYFEEVRNVISVQTGLKNDAEEVVKLAKSFADDLLAHPGTGANNGKPTIHMAQAHFEQFLDFPDNVQARILFHELLHLAIRMEKGKHPSEADVQEEDERLAEQHGLMPFSDLLTSLEELRYQQPVTTMNSKLDKLEKRLAQSQGQHQKVFDNYYEKRTQFEEARKWRDKTQARLESLEAAIPSLRQELARAEEHRTYLYDMNLEFKNMSRAVRNKLNSDIKAAGESIFILQTKLSNSEKSYEPTKELLETAEAKLKTAESELNDAQKAVEALIKKIGAIERSKRIVASMARSLGKGTLIFLVAFVSLIAVEAFLLPGLPHAGQMLVGTGIPREMLEYTFYGVLSAGAAGAIYITKGIEPLKDESASPPARRDSTWAQLRNRLMETREKGWGEFEKALYGVDLSSRVLSKPARIAINVDSFIANGEGLREIWTTNRIFDGIIRNLAGNPNISLATIYLGDTGNRFSIAKARLIKFLEANEAHDRSFFNLKRDGDDIVLNGVRIQIKQGLASPQDLALNNINFLIHAAYPEYLELYDELATSGSKEEREGILSSVNIARQDYESKIAAQLKEMPEKVRVLVVSSDEDIAEDVIPFSSDSDARTSSRVSRRVDTTQILTYADKDVFVLPTPETYAAQLIHASIAQNSGETVKVAPLSAQTERASRSGSDFRRNIGLRGFEGIDKLLPEGGDFSGSVYDSRPKVGASFLTYRLRITLPNDSNEIINADKVNTWFTKINSDGRRFKGLIVTQAKDTSSKHEAFEKYGDVVLPVTTVTKSNIPGENSYDVVVTAFYNEIGFAKNAITDLITELSMFDGNIAATHERHSVKFPEGTMPKTHNPRDGQIYKKVIEDGEEIKVLLNGFGRMGLNENWQLWWDPNFEIAAVNGARQDALNVIERILENDDVFLDAPYRASHEGENKIRLTDREERITLVDDKNTTYTEIVGRKYTVIDAIHGRVGVWSNNGRIESIVLNGEEAELGEVVDNLNHTSTIEAELREGTVIRITFDNFTHKPLKAGIKKSILLKTYNERIESDEYKQKSGESDERFAERIRKYNSKKSERLMARIPELGSIDIVVEGTGDLKANMLQPFLMAGAKSVVISNPDTTVDATIIPGANFGAILPAWKIAHILSCASCTTNAAVTGGVPILDILRILGGYMNTLHPYTNTQAGLFSKPQLGGGKRGAVGAFPGHLVMYLTTTGAASELSRALPEYEGIKAVAIRDATGKVSGVNYFLTVASKEGQKLPTAEEINQHVKKAVETNMKGYLGYKETVSSSLEMTQSPQGGVFIGSETKIRNVSKTSDGREIGELEIAIGYDNEWGYVSQLIKLVMLLALHDREEQNAPGIMAENVVPSAGNYPGKVNVTGMVNAKDAKKAGARSVLIAPAAYRKMHVQANSKRISGDMVDVDRVANQALNEALNEGIDTPIVSLSLAFKGEDVEDLDRESLDEEIKFALRTQIQQVLNGGQDIYPKETKGNVIPVEFIPRIVFAFEPGETILYKIGVDGVQQYHEYIRTIVGNVVEARYNVEARYKPGHLGGALGSVVAGRIRVAFKGSPQLLAIKNLIAKADVDGVILDPMRDDMMGLVDEVVKLFNTASNSNPSKMEAFQRYGRRMFLGGILNPDSIDETTLANKYINRLQTRSQHKFQVELGTGLGRSRDLSAMLRGYTVPQRESRAEDVPLKVMVQNVVDTSDKAFMKRVRRQFGKLPEGFIDINEVSKLGGHDVLIAHSEVVDMLGLNDKEINNLVKRAHALKAAGKITGSVVVGVSWSKVDEPSGAEFDTLNRQAARRLEGLNAEQLSGTVIAIEPQGAIGTGQALSPEKIASAAKQVRNRIRANVPQAADSVRIIYGGSLDESNAETILAIEDIDGALIGGASQKVDRFKQIVEIAAKIANQKAKQGHPYRKIYIGGNHKGVALAESYEEFDEAIAALDRENVEKGLPSLREILEISLGPTMSRITELADVYSRDYTQGIVFVDDLDDVFYNDEFKNKVFLIRADFNVTIDEAASDPSRPSNWKIAGDLRLRETIATINYIRERGGVVVVGTHFEPKQKKIQGAVSIEPIIKPRLAEYLGLKSEDIPFIREIALKTDSGWAVSDSAKSMLAEAKSGSVLLLENLRLGDYGKAEKAKDKATRDSFMNAVFGAFPAGRTVFTNDAFGLAHRDEASNTSRFKGKGMPRIAGLLMKKELQLLNKIFRRTSNKPVAMIVGGAKIEDKVRPLKNMLYNGTLRKGDGIFVYGGAALPFFAAQGEVQAGKSQALITDTAVKYATEILELADRKGVNIALPYEGLVVASELPSNPENKVHKETVKGDIGRRVAPSVPQDKYYYDIAPEVIKSLRYELFNLDAQGDIVNAKYDKIIMAGPPGVFEYKEFSEGTRGIFEVLAQAANRGVQVILGGGDTGNAAETIEVEPGKKLADMIAPDKRGNLDISTGGGALLEALEGKVLPGIKGIRNHEDALAYHIKDRNVKERFHRTIEKVNDYAASQADDWLKLAALHKGSMTALLLYAAGMPFWKALGLAGVARVFRAVDRIFETKTENLVLEQYFRGIHDYLDKKAEEIDNLHLWNTLNGTEMDVYDLLNDELTNGAEPILKNESALPPVIDGKVVVIDAPEFMSKRHWVLGFTLRSPPDKGNATNFYVQRAAIEWLADKKNVKSDEELKALIKLWVEHERKEKSLISEGFNLRSAHLRTLKEDDPGRKLQNFADSVVKSYRSNRGNTEKSFSLKNIMREIYMAMAKLPPIGLTIAPQEPEAKLKLLRAVAPQLADAPVEPPQDIESQIRRIANITKNEPQKVHQALVSSLNVEQLWTDLAEAGQTDKKKLEQRLSEVGIKLSALKKFVDLDAALLLIAGMLGDPRVMLERVRWIFINAIRPQHFVNSLIGTARLQIQQNLLTQLIKAGVLHKVFSRYLVDIIPELPKDDARLKTITVDNLINREALNYSGDTIGDTINVNVSLPSEKGGKLVVDSDAWEVLQYHFRVIRAESATRTFNYRGKVKEYYQNDFKVKVEPQLDDFIARNFTSKGKTIKYVVSSGIGANEEYTRQLAELHNITNPKIRWIVVNNPVEWFEVKPEDATADNTIFFDISRSGDAQETVKTFEFTFKEFPYRVVAANKGALHELAVRQNTNGNRLILSLPSDIGGRLMRRVTPMVYAPMYLAGMDVQTYVEKTDHFDNVLAFEKGKDSLAVNLAEFLLAMFLLNHRSELALFAVGATKNAPLVWSAEELQQLWMEGAQKRGSVSAPLQILLLPHHSHKTLEGVLGQFGKYIAIMLLAKTPGKPLSHLRLKKDEVAKADKKHVGLSPDDTLYGLALGNRDRVQELLPAIAFEIDHPTPITAAALTTLWEDTDVHYTALTGQDPHANPEVASVRKRGGEHLAAVANAIRNALPLLLVATAATLLASYHPDFMRYVSWNNLTNLWHNPQQLIALLSTTLLGGLIIIGMVFSKRTSGDEGEVAMLLEIKGAPYFDNVFDAVTWLIELREKYQDKASLGYLMKHLKVFSKVPKDKGSEWVTVANVVNNLLVNKTIIQRDITQLWGTLTDDKRRDALNDPMIIGRKYFYERRLSSLIFSYPELKEYAEGIASFMMDLFGKKAIIDAARETGDFPNIPPISDSAGNLNKESSKQQEPETWKPARLNDGAEIMVGRGVTTATKRPQHFKIDKGNAGLTLKAFLEKESVMYRVKRRDTVYVIQVGTPVKAIIGEKDVSLFKPVLALGDKVSIISPIAGGSDKNEEQPSSVKGLTPEIRELAGRVSRLAESLFGKEMFIDDVGLRQLMSQTNEAYKAAESEPDNQAKVRAATTLIKRTYNYLRRESNKQDRIYVKAEELDFAPGVPYRYLEDDAGRITIQNSLLLFGSLGLAALLFNNIVDFGQVWNMALNWKAWLLTPLTGGFIVMVTAIELHALFEASAALKNAATTLRESARKVESSFPILGKTMSSFAEALDFTANGLGLSARSEEESKHRKVYENSKTLQQAPTFKNLSEAINWLKGKVKVDKQLRELGFENSVNALRIGEKITRKEIESHSPVFIWTADTALEKENEIREDIVVIWNLLTAEERKDVLAKRVSIFNEEYMSKYKGDRTFVAPYLWRIIPNEVGKVITHAMDIYGWDLIEKLARETNDLPAQSDSGALWDIGIGDEDAREVPKAKLAQWTHTANLMVQKTENISPRDINGELVRTMWLVDPEMPQGMSAYNFRVHSPKVKEGVLVIVTKKYFEEGTVIEESAYHELLEDYWMRIKGLDARSAHILAAADQRLAFGQTGITKFDSEQITSMSLDKLKRIYAEDSSRRRPHHDLIGKHFGSYKLKRVQAYEERFRAAIIERIKKLTTPIAGGSDKYSGPVRSTTKQPFLTQEERNVTGPREFIEALERWAEKLFVEGPAEPGAKEVSAEHWESKSTLPGAERWMLAGNARVEQAGSLIKLGVKIAKPEPEISETEIVKIVEWVKPVLESAISDFERAARFSSDYEYDVQTIKTLLDYPERFVKILAKKYAGQKEAKPTETKPDMPPMLSGLNYEQLMAFIEKVNSGETPLTDLIGYFQETGLDQVSIAVKHLSAEYQQAFKEGIASLPGIPPTIGGGSGRDEESGPENKQERYARMINRIKTVLGKSEVKALIPWKTRKFLVSLLRQAETKEFKVRQLNDAEQSFILLEKPLALLESLVTIKQHIGAASAPEKIESATTQFLSQLLEHFDSPAYFPWEQQVERNRFIRLVEQLPEAQKKQVSEGLIKHFYERRFITVSGQKDILHIEILMILAPSNLDATIKTINNAIMGEGGLKLLRPTKVKKAVELLIKYQSHIEVKKLFERLSNPDTIPNIYKGTWWRSWGIQKKIENALKSEETSNPSTAVPMQPVKIAGLTLINIGLVLVIAWTAALGLDWFGVANLHNSWPWAMGISGTLSLGMLSLFRREAVRYVKEIENAADQNYMRYYEMVEGEPQLNSNGQMLLSQFRAHLVNDLYRTNKLSLENSEKIAALPFELALPGKPKEARERIGLRGVVNAIKSVWTGKYGRSPPEETMRLKYDQVTGQPVAIQLIPSLLKDLAIVENLNKVRKHKIPSGYLLRNQLLTPEQSIHFLEGKITSSRLAEGIYHEIGHVLRGKDNEIAATWMERYAGPHAWPRILINIPFLAIKRVAGSNGWLTLGLIAVAGDSGRERSQQEDKNVGKFNEQLLELFDMFLKWHGRDNIPRHIHGEMLKAAAETWRKTNGDKEKVWETLNNKKKELGSVGDKPLYLLTVVGLLGLGVAALFANGMFDFGQALNAVMNWETWLPVLGTGLSAFIFSIVFQQGMSSQNPRRWEHAEAGEVRTTAGLLKDGEPIPGRTGETWNIHSIIPLQDGLRLFVVNGPTYYPNELIELSRPAIDRPFDIERKVIKNGDEIQGAPISISDDISVSKSGLGIILSVRRGGFFSIIEFRRDNLQSDFEFVGEFAEFGESLKNDEGTLGNYRQPLYISDDGLSAMVRAKVHVDRKETTHVIEYRRSTPNGKFKPSQIIAKVDGTMQGIQGEIIDIGYRPLAVSNNDLRMLLSVTTRSLYRRSAYHLIEYVRENTREDFKFAQVDTADNAIENRETFPGINYPLTHIGSPLYISDDGLRVIFDGGIDEGSATLEQVRTNANDKFSSVSMVIEDRKKVPNILGIQWNRRLGTTNVYGNGAGMFIGNIVKDPLLDNAIQVIELRTGNVPSIPPISGGSGKEAKTPDLFESSSAEIAALSGKSRWDKKKVAYLLEELLKRLEVMENRAVSSGPHSLPVNIAQARTLYDNSETLQGTQHFDDVDSAIKWLKSARENDVELNMYSLGYLMTALWAGNKIPEDELRDWTLTASAVNYALEHEEEISGTIRHIWQYSYPHSRRLMLDELSEKPSPLLPLWEYKLTVFLRGVMFTSLFESFIKYKIEPVLEKGKYLTSDLREYWYIIAKSALAFYGRDLIVEMDSEPGELPNILPIAGGSGEASEEGPGKTEDKSDIAKPGEKEFQQWAKELHDVISGRRYGELPNVLLDGVRNYLPQLLGDKVRLNNFINVVRNLPYDVDRQFTRLLVEHIYGASILRTDTAIKSESIQTEQFYSQLLFALFKFNPELIIKTLINAAVGKEGLRFSSQMVALAALKELAMLLETMFDVLIGLFGHLGFLAVMDETIRIKKAEEKMESGELQPAMPPVQPVLEQAVPVTTEQFQELRTKLQEAIDAGYSQKYIAREARVSQVTIDNIIRGKVRAARPRTQRKILSILDRLPQKGKGSTHAFDLPGLKDGIKFVRKVALGLTPFVGAMVAGLIGLDVAPQLHAVLSPIVNVLGVTGLFALGAWAKFEFMRPYASYMDSIGLEVNNSGRDESGRSKARWTYKGGEMSEETALEYLKQTELRYPKWLFSPKRYVNEVGRHEKFSHRPGMFTLVPFVGKYLAEGLQKLEIASSPLATRNDGGMVTAPDGFGKLTTGKLVPEGRNRGSDNYKTTARQSLSGLKRLLAPPLTTMSGFFSNLAQRKKLVLEVSIKQSEDGVFLAELSQVVINPPLTTHLSKLPASYAVKAANYLSPEQLPRGRELQNIAEQEQKHVKALKKQLVELNETAKGSVNTLKLAGQVHGFELGLAELGNIKDTTVLQAKIKNELNDMLNAVPAKDPVEIKVRINAYKKGINQGYSESKWPVIANNRGDDMVEVDSFEFMDSEAKEHTNPHIINVDVTGLASGDAEVVPEHVRVSVKKHQELLGKEHIKPMLVFVSRDTGIENWKENVKTALAGIADDETLRYAHYISGDELAEAGLLYQIKLGKDDVYNRVKTTAYLKNLPNLLSITRFKATIATNSPYGWEKRDKAVVDEKLEELVESLDIWLFGAGYVINATDSIGEDYKIQNAIDIGA